MANITVFENAERELYYQLASGSPEVVLLAEDAMELLSFIHNAVDYINEVDRLVCESCHFALESFCNQVGPSSISILKNLDSSWFS